MDLYQHRHHNKNLLMAHIILVTKYRKRLLIGSINDDIKQRLYDACAKRHWYIRKMESDKDHIHILLQYNPTDNISAIVSFLKQQTTWYIWQRHGDILRHHYWKERTFWSDGYFAASIGQVSKSVIERYIEAQG